MFLGKINYLYGRLHINKHGPLASCQILSLLSTKMHVLQHSILYLSILMHHLLLNMQRRSLTTPPPDLKRLHLVSPCDPGSFITYGGQTGVHSTGPPPRGPHSPRSTAFQGSCRTPFKADYLNQADQVELGSVRSG